MLSLPWFAYFFLSIGLMFIFFAFAKSKAPNSFLVLLVAILGTILIGLTFQQATIADYWGRPAPFDRLGMETFIKIKNIGENTALIQLEKSEPRLVKNVPKEIMSMKEGTAFELKDMPVITISGKYIAPIPIIHPH